jgi:hypothetical protein
MTFVPASDPRELGVLVGGLAAAFGSLNWLTSRQNADPGKVVAHCADGSVIGVRERSVRRRPRRGVKPRLLGGPSRPRVREDLERGDLCFMRVREGRAGEAPWVVEGLDRDPEPYSLHWEFETVEEALAAYRVIEERIADPPRNEQGEIVRLDDVEFDARLLEAAASSERGV